MSIHSPRNTIQAVYFSSTFFNTATSWRASWGPSLGSPSSHLRRIFTLGFFLRLSASCFCNSFANNKLLLINCLPPQPLTNRSEGRTPSQFFSLPPNMPFGELLMRHIHLGIVEARAEQLGRSRVEAAHRLEELDGLRVEAAKRLEEVSQRERSVLVKAGELHAQWRNLILHGPMQKTWIPQISHLLAVRV